MYLAAVTAVCSASRAEGSATASSVQQLPQQHWGRHPEQLCCLQAQVLLIILWLGPFRVVLFPKISHPNNLGGIASEAHSTMILGFGVEPLGHRKWGEFSFVFLSFSFSFSPISLFSSSFYNCEKMRLLSYK